MTRLLALDTSAESCSAALWCNGEVTGTCEHAPRQQSRRLMPMIDELLASSGVTLSSLDAIAYGHGPGSFTGIRIAAGTAQGLAWGIERPLLGISTLETLALQAYLSSGAELVLPALDARMGELYSALYRVREGRPEVLLDERVHPPEELILPPLNDGDVLHGIGSGWKLAQQLPKAVRSRACEVEADREPDASAMVRLAATRLEAGNFKAIAYAIPVYLRDQVTTR
ncbi:tRNA (adenosine(37)-N6)-threonylcarbamoyltransferase complex dimerization subunit type 1 TsaB [Kushneria phosphatilytica]|uniref:tRNA threonylcarbamoyladenosine biosynthesis protein TsaB n=1 Tax=Kushneria phosphatilytica TaxID=657387 RepID=A0A1S1NZF4_9GAMM|nr:tRNA (adenosine(37)-N6)-threonylcarbamoyltransferase complex dimerization subunit type 1 TsaB [Kushneria phosphatilytica]OHV13452.1 tRNA (adenosine(37)-N6)-threonylcarbamoyltransferase complex dimerization subunit type 1 TsaB [Kushneria phosphatilytica]QEL10536.1 tRNA (adenosine(37)-N6)-threonylcarbamoyltransferase complex dimerization subunit type 1 TsaB [Kushneria phosphatilytica]